MTDILRIAHLRIAHQVANPEVGNPEGIQNPLSSFSFSKKMRKSKWRPEGDPKNVH